MADVGRNHDIVERGAAAESGSEGAGSPGSPIPGVARGRAAAGLSAAWGAVTGLAPHVLHHVGPLAGAAILAGTGGRVLFAGVAVVVSVPFLLRLHRRFGTWLAPAIAFVVMAALFSLSSFVIGPAISGTDPASPTSPSLSPVDQHGH